MSLLLNRPKPDVSEARRRRSRVTRPILILSAVALLVSLGGAVTWPALRAGRRATCVKHLKALGLAFHEYQNKHGHFPAPAITGKDGTPLLSWRVQLLPHLGRQDLYDRFHKDEPWDSPHNLALLSQMPEVFGCPSELGRTKGLTTYMVVVGPKAGLGTVGTMFEPGRGIDLREVSDGTSNTIMVAESGRPVPWTKPDVIPFGDGLPHPSFGSRHPNGFNALFADGSVRFLKFTMAPTTLWLLLTRDGGEVLSA